MTEPTTPENPENEFDSLPPLEDGDELSVPRHTRPPRPGSARERQLRRKQRLTGEEEPESVPVRPPVTGAGSSSGHLNRLPPVEFKPPSIKIPHLKWIAGLILAVVLVVTVINLLGLYKGEVVSVVPNGLWIGTEWTYATHEPEAIEEFVAHLKKNQIGEVYAWVSWLQVDNTWRGAQNFNNVQQFVQQFKASYPEARLYGWVSLPVDVGDGNYRLDDETVQKAVADFSARVVQTMGFDGVFLNIEPVWNGDENFLVLLRQVRLAVGPDVPISAAIPPDWSPLGVDIPVPPLIVPGTVWDKSYKQSVALLVDQLAIMAYNSGLTVSAGFTPADYSAWMAYQVVAYTEAVAELGINTEVMMGIPTYEAELPGHDPMVETVPAAVAGVIEGLRQVGENASRVRGVAIYAGWETDETEWEQFHRYWVNR